MPPEIASRITPEEYNSALSRATSTAQKMAWFGIGTFVLCIIISSIVNAILSPKYIAPKYVCLEAGGDCTSGLGGPSSGCCTYFCCPPSAGWMSTEGMEGTEYLNAECTSEPDGLNGKECTYGTEPRFDRGRTVYNTVYGVVRLSGANVWDGGKEWPREVSNTVGFLLFVVGVSTLMSVVCCAMPRRVERHFHGWRDKGVVVMYRGVRCGRCSAYLIMSTPDHQQGTMLGPMGGVGVPMAPGGIGAPPPVGAYGAAPGAYPVAQPYGAQPYGNPGPYGGGGAYTNSPPGGAPPAYGAPAIGQPAYPQGIGSGGIPSPGGAYGPR